MIFPVLNKLLTHHIGDECIRMRFSQLCRVMSVTTQFGNQVVNSWPQFSWNIQRHSIARAWPEHVKVLRPSKVRVGIEHLGTQTPGPRTVQLGKLREPLAPYDLVQRLRCYTS